MNILYVPTKDPRLTNGGNEQRTNLLWESLKRHGKVYTFVADKTLGVCAEITDGEHPIYKYRPEEKNNLFWKVVNSILARLSLFCIYERNITKMPNPQKVFEGIEFDIVVTRYIYPLCKYKYWGIAPLLIDIDDHPLQVYATVRKKELPFLLRKMGEIVTRKQANYIINKAFGGWIANEEQVKQLGDNYYYLPNIPQSPSTSYRANYGERIDLFTVGAMGYLPNRSGVARFLKEIWPLFHNKYPKVSYFIVGKGATDEDVRKWNSYDGVEYLGFVEKLEAFYEKTLATVVPVYSGGGTCIKTLESLSFSRVCLSTKFGARGLAEAIDGQKGLLIFNNSEEFVAQFEKILDANERQKIEQNGSAYIRINYSTDSFDKSVDKVLQLIFLK